MTTSITAAAPARASTAVGRTVGATFVGIASFGLSLAQTAILVPVILVNWGPSRYGMWIALNAFVGILQTIDAGHQTLVGNEVNLLYFQNHIVLKRVLASAVRIAWVLGAFSALVIIALSRLSRLGAAMGIDAKTARDENLFLCTLILVATWGVVGSVGGVLVRLYIPAGLLVTSICWSIGANILTTVSLAACALGRLSILQACIVISFSTLILNVFLFRDLFMRFSALRPFSQGAEWKTGFINLGKSLVITSSGALSQFQTSWLVILIGSAYGAALIPTFTTIRTVSNSFLQCTSIVSLATFPEITRYHARQEADKVLACLTSSWFVSGAGVNLLIVSTIPCIEWLYQVWTRGTIGFDWRLYLLLASAISMKNYGSPLVSYLSGINDLRAQMWTSAGQCITVIPVAVLLIQRLGLTGIGIALLSGEVVGSIIFPLVFVSRQLNKIGAKLPARQAVSALSSVVIVIVACLAIGCQWLTSMQASTLAASALLALGIVQWLALPPIVRTSFRDLIGRAKQGLSRSVNTSLK